jgi:hypothetical protein
MVVKKDRIFWVWSLWNLFFYYGIAFAIWGLALRIGVTWGALAGVLAALLLSFTVCAYPIFHKPISEQELRDQTHFIGVWARLAVILGVAGLVTWGIRALLFS